MSNWIDEYVLKEEKDFKNRMYKVCVYCGSGKWESTTVVYDTEEDARSIAKDNSAHTPLFWCVSLRDMKLALYLKRNEVLPVKE